MRPLLAALLLTAAWAGPAFAQSSGATSSSASSVVDLARGRPYTLTPRPNYALTTDAGDDRQLTDGAVVDSATLWTQPGTVGWANVAPVTIVIDLGSIQPIGGVTFHTAAGRADVAWPRSIFTLVSDDGSHFSPMADLTTPPPGGVSPPSTGYATFRYTSGPLAAHGRFVALIVDPTGPYVFCDEVEVFAGDPAAISATTGSAPVTSLPVFFTSAHETVSLRRRLTTDLASARVAVDAAAIGQDARAEIVNALDLAAAAVPAQVVTDPTTFTTVWPINDLHARILAIRGRLAEWRGDPDVSAWVINPWTFATPYDAPPPDAAAGVLAIAAMNGERRSGAVAIANGTAHPISVSLQLEGLSDETARASVVLKRVLWTDTRELVPVADALVPLEPGASFSLPAGITTQVWVSFAPRSGVPASLDGTLDVVTDHGFSTRVPLSLRVLPGAVAPAHPLVFGGWDYTDDGNALKLPAATRSALIGQMRDLGVNAPWATSRVMPAGRFDPSGHLTALPDTTSFDRWIAEWPDAARYMVFASVGEALGGVPTSAGGAFTQAVAEWLAFGTAHMSALGIDPSRLMLLLVDEPHAASQDARITAWGRAIRLAQSGIGVWEDPTYLDPATSSPQLSTVVDQLALKRSLLARQGKPFTDYFLGRRDAGSSLAVYGSSGPARLLDPYAYDRLQPWLAASLGAEASFFWSFADDGGQSWNEYATLQVPYSPFFLSADAVYPSKHSEAMREGLADYAYIAMLRDRIDVLAHADDGDVRLTAGRTLLDRASSELAAGANAPDLRWATDRDRTGAERRRLQIADLLAWLDATSSDGTPTGAPPPSNTLSVPQLVVRGGTVEFDGATHPARTSVTGAYGLPVAGTLVVTFSPGDGPPVNPGIYTATATFTSADPNYASASATATIVIHGTSLTTATVSPAQIVYGTPAAVTVTVTSIGSVPSGPAWAPQGTLMLTDNGAPVATVDDVRSGAVTVALGVLPAGRHAIAARFSGDTVLAASLAETDIVVARAVPDIVWPAPPPLTFGMAVPASALAAVASIPGTFSYDMLPGAVLNAGTYAVTALFTPADVANFTERTATATLLVGRAAPAISVSNVQAQYDGAPHPPIATAAGLDGAPVAGVFAFTYDPGGTTPPSRGGTYTATASFVSADPNYSDGTGAGQISIVAPTTASLVWPPDGAVDVDLTSPLQWTPVQDVQAYYLYVGSTPGAKDLVNSGETPKVSYRAIGVPGGQLVYVRLWVKVGGIWRYRESRFSTLRTTATLLSPTASAAIDVLAVFRWTPVGGAQAYYLYVGTTPGAKDLVNTGELMETGFTAPALPRGQVVYVRLWTKLGGVWRFVDSTFTTSMR